MVYTEVAKHQIGDREAGDQIAANGFDFVIEEVRTDTYLLRLDEDTNSTRAQPKWHYGDHCDRCGLPFNGWVNHYSHGRVCNRCDVEMHSSYPYHGVRGYPAHQLQDEE